jgi:hypothetical protein
MTEPSANLAKVNRVDLRDGVIIITQSGDQTYISVMALLRQAQAYAQDLDDVKVLVDHRQVGKLDIGARRAGFEVMKRFKFRKIAFIGTPPYMSGLLTLLTRSVGRHHAMRIAKTEAEALAWLNR